MAQRLRRYRSDHDLKQCGSFDGDTYRSRWYQGFGAGMEWLRLILEGTDHPQVRVYTADQIPEEGVELEPVMFQPADDLLLYGVCGRYLRFTVSPADGLRGYELSFPGNSIDQGLPAVMQGDETMRRFLGVYQSCFQELNQTRAAFPGRLAPTGPDPLPGLGRWLGALRWLRGAPCAEAILAAAPRLNRIRGTRRGLDLLLKLVTNGKGELVEQFQCMAGAGNADERADCAQLYGTDPASVTLLLPAGLPDGTLEFLKDVLEDFLPAGESYALIPLEDGAPMDGYCYLDENAQLTEPSPPVLDAATLEDMILE